MPDPPDVFTSLTGSKLFQLPYLTLQNTIRNNNFDGADAEMLAINYRAEDGEIYSKAEVEWWLHLLAAQTFALMYLQGAAYEPIAAAINHGYSFIAVQRKPVNEAFF